MLQQVSAWFHNHDDFTVAKTLLLSSILIPWGVGFTSLNTFDMTVYHVRVWIGELFYAPGVDYGVFGMADVTAMYGHDTVLYAVILWHASSAILGIIALFALAVEFKPDAIKQVTPPIPTVAAGLALAGVGYCAAAVIFTFSGFDGVTVPISGVLMLVFAGFLTRRSTSLL